MVSGVTRRSISWTVPGGERRHREMPWSGPPSIAMSSALVPSFLSAFFGFLAIMNLLANAPVFLGLTSGYSAEERRSVALRAVLVAFVLVAVFALAGDAILHAFGVSIPGVRAFGGLIVAHVGFQLLTKAQAAAHSPSGEASHEGLGVAISPLAIPILAGPGTLATALGFAAGASFLTKVATLSAFAAVCALTVIAFLTATKLVKRLGEEFIDALTKVMGMILGAIGIQMLIAGISALLKA
jgi:multiple antibiotic resistance protein